MKPNTNNLVALIRATKKGQKMSVNNRAVGGAGRDGRKQYKIHKLAVGKWFCSCPAFRFGRGMPCKHLVYLWDQYRNGVTDFETITIKNHGLLERGIVAAG